MTASYALARVRFRGRTLLLLTILAVSMFPQIAVLAGLFELIRFIGVFNTPWALIISYTIFTLPFTVWVLTTFMRDLPIEIEEAAIVDGATPWVIITKVFMPLMWPALVTTGLLAFIGAWNEFLFALTFTSSNTTRTVPVAIALLSRRHPVRDPLGHHHGGLGDRHRAADRSGPDLPAQDRRRPDRRRRQGIRGSAPWRICKLSDVRKSYGAVDVIKGVDLEIETGEFMVFVGPSGCGKSTLLRLISGLEDITSGDMLFDDERVNDLAPSKRGIAMVFQSYALYPHMKVYDNMAFGMKLQKAGADDIKERVMKAAKLLQIDHLLDRLPKQLSGGQRQRVAIGRAIVRDPRVFLFDEPLSNLDAALRVATRLEIAKLHHSMGNVTMVYVTHDQVEAMTLADRICVLRDGLVMQVGTPDRALREAELDLRRRLHRLAEDELPERRDRPRLRLRHPRHPLRAHRRRQRQPDLEGRGGPRREPRVGQLPLRRHRLRRAGAGAPGGQDRDPLGRAHRHPADRGEPAPLRRQGRADAVTAAPRRASFSRGWRRTMKEVRITLSDDQVAAIEAEIAAGEARSVSELVELALDAYLTPPDMPSREQMLADVAEVEAELAAGGRLYTGDEMLEFIRKSLRE